MDENLKNNNVGTVPYQFPKLMNRKNNAIILLIYELIFELLKKTTVQRPFYFAKNAKEKRAQKKDTKS